VEEFKLRRLHRQRRRRRNTASILNHTELAQLFDVAEKDLKQALCDAGWDFHEDAQGHLWASVSEDLLQRSAEDSQTQPNNSGANGTR